MRQPICGRTIPALFVLFLFVPLAEPASKRQTAHTTATNHAAP
jgi:hypothetical protein